MLDRLAHAEGVIAYQRDGVAERPARRPGPGPGPGHPAGRRRRPPHPGRAPHPHPRGPLLRRPRRPGRVRRGQHPGRVRPGRPLRPQAHGAVAQRPDGGGPVSWSRIWTVTRTDLKQLIQAKDFWIPMLILGGIFFLFVPTILLALDHGHRRRRRPWPRSARPWRSCPNGPRPRSGVTPTPGRASYALAVYLFAPVAVVVPLTISTAVGAVDHRRRAGAGHRRVPGPLPRRRSGRSTSASSSPASCPATSRRCVGFGIYSLIVNLIVGPEVGGWFFPTRQWWVLMLWVVPPFLALTLSIVLRLSARVKSTAAAQQASGLVTLPLILVAYSPVDRRPLRRRVGLALDRRRRLGRRPRRPQPRHAGRHPSPPPRRRRRHLTPSPGGARVSPGSEWTRE